MVQRLGFVQVDTVAAVERAQHHILFSRNRRYKHKDLSKLIEKKEVAKFPLSFYQFVS